MRIIFTGSRKWAGIYAEARAGEVLARLETFAVAIGSPLVIVHGNYHEGLDAVVDRWAIRHGYVPEHFDAKWETYGLAAGPIRNQEMVDAGADMCLGFPLPGGRGTQDCMNRARLARIPTFTIAWNATEPTEQMLPEDLQAA
jgi:hypothetical protein